VKQDNSRTARPGSHPPTPSIVSCAVCERHDLIRELVDRHHVELVAKRPPDDPDLALLARLLRNMRQERQVLVVLGSGESATLHALWSHLIGRARGDERARADVADAAVAWLAAGTAELNRRRPGSVGHRRHQR
jgi:hypothetical protein